MKELKKMVDKNNQPTEGNTNGTQAQQTEDNLENADKQQPEQENEKEEISKSLEETDSKNKENVDVEEDEEIKFGKKRAKRKQKVKIQRGNEKRKAEKKIGKYYGASYIGESIAGVMYSLCQQLNKENNKMLWYWILGLCDQLVQGRIPSPEYLTKSEEIYKEVSRLNRFANRKSHLILKMGGSSEEALTLRSDREPIGSLSGKTELNLFLLHNWNLYESLKYSDMIIPKSKLWHQSNEFELKKLVARMGIPLIESKQKFQFMKSQFKEGLNEKVARMIEKGFLEDLFVTDFIRQFDNKNKFGALDISRMANSLLTCPYDFTGKFI